MESVRFTLGFLLILALPLAGCSKAKPNYKSVPVRTLEKADQPVYMSADNRPLTVVHEGLVFAFDPDLPENFRQACRLAMATANEAMGRSVIDTTDTPGEFSDAPDGQSTISYGKNPAATGRGHAAETEIAFVGDRIVEADIDIDLKHFGFTDSDEPGKADMQSVCLHELGHALGLGHSKDPASVMSEVLNVSQNRHAFTAADIRNLRNAAESIRVVGK